MSRFKVQDRVRILPTVGSRFVGLEGVVVEVQPQPRGLTQLDRYVVRFNWGETQSFWDAELGPTHTVVER